MRRALALAALGALALAACSDDDGGGEPGPSVTFTTTAPTGSSAPATTTGDTATPTSDAPSTEPPASTAPLTEGSVTFTRVVEGFERPVDIAWRPGDAATAFVVEQSGHILPVVDATVGAAVVDLSREVSDGNEQGLLGLAFHPTEPYAYVDYTRRDGDTVIQEYRLADDGSWTDAREVLVIGQPYGNHNGGNLAFGPDGFLYIGMGDGGSGFDPERRALNVSELLGKILRIDPRPSGDQPYGVPSDNPFVDVAGARPEVWSVGLRNPWRFSFDSATGDLWIADVGQNAWEEIDVARADGGPAGRGMNFGWSALEGTHTANDDQSAEGSTAPVWEYAHGDDGCSVSGGTVYRGSAVASLSGWYLFGDYCSGKVWALVAPPGGAATVVQLGQIGAVSAIRSGPDGELYVLTHGDGLVLRIDPA